MASLVVAVSNFQKRAAADAKRVSEGTARLSRAFARARTNRQRRLDTFRTDQAFETIARDELEAWRTRKEKRDEDLRAALEAVDAIAREEFNDLREVFGGGLASTDGSISVTFDSDDEPEIST